MNVCTVAVDEASSKTDSLTLYDESCMEVFTQLLQNEVKNASQTQILVVSILYVLISIIGIFGNGCILFIVIRKASLLNTLGNVLIANLALSNLLLSIVIYPLLWLPWNKNGVFKYGSGVCKLTAAVPTTNIYCSAVSVTVLAIDRYRCAKKLHLTNQHTHHGTLERVVSLVFIWSFSIALSAPLLVLYKSYTPRWLRGFGNVPLLQGGVRDFTWNVCEMPETNAYAKLAVNAIQVTFLYVVPFAVVGVFNWRLGQFVAHAQQRRRSLVLHHGKGTTVVRRELGSRVNILLMAMFAAYAVLWLPATILTPLLDFNLIDHKKVMVVWFNNLSKVMSLSTVCINPLLYGFFNTNFHAEFVRMCSKLRCSGHASEIAATVRHRSIPKGINNRGKMKREGAERMQLGSMYKSPLYSGSAEFENKSEANCDKIKNMDESSNQT